MSFLWTVWKRGSLLQQEQKKRLLEVLRSLKKNRPVLRTPGLSQNEFFLLYHMREHLHRQGEDSMRIGDLHHCTHTSLPAVSQSLGVLEAKGFVVRSTDPGDRRSVKVSLTPEGDEAIETALEKARNFLNRLETKLGAENMEQLSEALDALWEEDAGERRNEWTAKKERQP